MNSNWTNMMWDAESAVGHWAIIYYVSWNIIGRQVLLNLFLAILIDNFTVSPRRHRLSSRAATLSVELQQFALLPWHLCPHCSPVLPLYQVVPWLPLKASHCSELSIPGCSPSAFPPALGAA